MNQILKRMLLVVAAVGLLSAVASADQCPLAVGYISWDITSTDGSTGEFDIINQSGPNSSGDPTFPITTPVNLESLSLTVDFSDSSTATYGPSDFILDTFDQISFDGLSLGGTSPEPVDATLTGTFDPLTVTLYDGSTETILPTFSATILPD